MLYDKYNYQKINDRKVLHKIKKHWVVISLSMLAALGGVSLADSSVHAQVTSPGSAAQAGQIANHQPGQATAGSNGRTQSALSGSAAQRNGSQIAARNVPKLTAVGRTQPLKQQPARTRQSKVQQIGRGAQQLHLRILQNALSHRYAVRKPSKLGDDLDINRIIIHYVDPSDGTGRDVQDVPESDSDGTPFNYRQFLGHHRSVKNQGVRYRVVKPDPHYQIPKVFRPGIQDYYIDVSRIKPKRPGYIVIDYDDITHGNIEQNHIQDSDVDGVPFMPKNTFYQEYLSAEAPVINGYQIVNAGKPGAGNIDLDKLPTHYIGGQVQHIEIAIEPLRHADPLYVNYIDMNPDSAHYRQSVNESDDNTALGRGLEYGTTFDVTKGSDYYKGRHWVPVPKGYHLMPHENTVYSIKGYTQHLKLDVEGDQVNPTYAIHRQEVNSDGKVIKNLSDASVKPLSDRVGDKVTFDPNNYVPQGYAVDKSDQKETAVVQTNGKLQPDAVTFKYISSADVNVKFPIQYENADTKQMIGSPFTVSGKRGSTFNYQPYLNSDSSNFPKGYYGAMLGQHPDKVTANQTSYILVHPDSDQIGYAQVRYVGPNGQEVSDLPAEQVTGHDGQAMDLSSYEQSARNKHYNVNSISPSSVVFSKNNTSNNPQVITINVARQQANGSIYYVNTKTRHQVGQRISISQPWGTNVNYNQYLYPPYIPQGYGYAQPADPNAKMAANGAYAINITPTDVTVNIEYRYNDQTKKTLSVPGLNGSPLDLSQYTKQSDMPKGYKYAGLDPTNKDVFTPGGTDIIDLQQNQIIGKIVFDDQSDNNQTVRTSSDSDLEGSSVPYAYYKNEVPSDYTFKGYAPDDSKTLEPNGHYIIYVSRKPVTASIVYEDAQTKQQIGQPQTYKGKPGDKVNYSQYLNTLPPHYVDPQIADPKATLSAGGQYVIYVNKQTSSDVTGTIVYEDSKTGHAVGQSRSVSGKAGSSINYSTYTASGMLPSGYDNPQIVDPQATLQNNGRYYIKVDKVKQPSSDVTGTIIYEDSKTGHAVGQSRSISGKAGSSINYSTYTASGMLPSGYDNPQIVDPQATLQNNGRYYIKVDEVKQPSSSDVTAYIQYRDQNTGQVIKTVSDHTQPGTSINYQNYEQQVPSDYVVTGLGDHNQVVEANQYNVINVAHKATAYLDYVDPNQTLNHGVVHTSDDPSYQGASIDYHGYEQKVPSGYALIGLGQHDDVVKDGEHNVILVKSTAPQEATSHLVYQDLDNNDHQVGQTINMKGVAGQPINYSPYISSVPSGYTYAGMGSHDTNYENGETNVIYLYEKGKSHHPNIKPVTASITYEDINSNNKVVDTKYDVAMPGTEIDYANYQNNIPSGYQFVGLGQHYDKVEKNENNVILVAENPQVIPSSDNTQASDQIVYENIDNGNQIVGSPVNIKGTIGQEINYTPYQENVPSGFTYAGMGSYYSRYGRNESPSVIYVSENNNHHPAIKISDVKATIQYKNIDNGNVVHTSDVTGLPGQSIDYSKYIKEMPNGYTYVGMGSYDDYLKSGEDNVILVKQTPNHHPGNNNHHPQSAVMTIDYMDGNRIVGHTTASGMTNAKFNVNPYTVNGAKGMPSNYHYAGQVSNVPADYNNGQTVYVYVAANGNNNNQPNNNGNNNNNSNNHPQSMATMIIYYMDGNQNVGTRIATGFSGSLFNSYPYLYGSNVPQGYQYDGHTFNMPITYNNAQVMDVDVKPVNNVTPNGGNNTPNQPINNGGNNTPSTPSTPSNNNNNVTPNNGNNTPNNRPINNGGNNTPSTPSTPSNNNNNVTPNNGNNTPNQPISNGGNNTPSTPSTPSNTTGQNVSGNDDNNQNGSQLPQTGEFKGNYAIGTLLATLGSTLAALGYAIDKKRRYNK